MLRVNKITSSLDVVIGVILNLDNEIQWTTNRSWFSSYHGIQSPIQSIGCGVTQDSILGPLFFIIIMNDIMQCVRATFYCSVRRLEQLFESWKR